MNDQGQAGELLELAGLLEGSSFRVWPKYAATKDENGRNRTYDIEKRKRLVRDISTFSN
jgi:hypothetical protein